MTRALHDLVWPRTTDRLVVRPPAAADLEAVHRYRSREDVDRFLGGTTGDLAHFTEWFTRPDRTGRSLVVQRDGAVIGDLMLAVQDGWAQGDVAAQAVGVEAEIGWCLDPAHAGLGLATEAVRELLAIAFDDLGLRRVVALCFVANERSWRLMERVGMRREQHGVEDSLHHELGWIDGYTYAQLASEWRRGQSAGRVTGP